MNITGYNEKMQGREYNNQYIDKQRLKADKIYRITLYSKDRISGTVQNGVYVLDVPEVIQDVNKYHLAVEDFIMASEPTAPGTNGINRTYIVETSITMPNTYSTSTKTNSRVLLQTAKDAVANSIVSYQHTINSNSVGIPLTDLTFMRQNQIRLTFKKADDTMHDATSMPDTSAFSMTFVIFPYYN
jgi:hypothetical protein